MNNGEKLLIMRNVRRFIDGRIKQPENWALYSKIFSVGATTSRDMCKEMKLDPDVCRFIDDK